MTPERRERVWVLFDEAVELPPGERAPLLDAACRDDAGLRAEVESLLAHHPRVSEDEDQEAFLKSPLLRSPEDPTIPSPSGGSVEASGLTRHIGHYRIVRALGTGGMGTVYEAEQDNPRRAVALKVIRKGFASPELVKRFTQEAQILGRLQHPGIAQIYEAGLAEDGQPYFAMELIQGLPLGEYADQHHLDSHARLALFAKVCDAVQHAHEKGVVHRDLKPSNILVNGTGQPKILDFGVAHATNADLETATGQTEAGQLLGTLSYMSPEQIAADPAALDHRSDVYTLGVILFELLGGRLPYQLEHLPLPEVARVIRDQDPSRLGSINTLFRGDVETIVAKALEKDKARRYPSAGALGEDLRRHLAHEPIRARPASALYKIRKFVRRNKGLVAGAAVVFAALLAATIISLFSAHDARQSARVAIEEKREAQFQAYRARIAAAVAALSAHDVADAARQLDAAPEELRDWEWRHLHSRLDDSFSVIPLTAAKAGFLIGAPDGFGVAAWTTDGLRLLDLESGKHRTLPIGPERQHSVTAAQTKAGLRVAVWLGNTSFELLDDAGKVLCRVQIPEAKEPGPVAVSPDGTRLACTPRDGERMRLVVFDAPSGKRTAVCGGHLHNIWAFTFSPDGTRLASGGDDNLARLWNSATGALLATCRGHTSKILGVAFSADGARLATTSADGTVRQWDTATGREVEAPYDRHSGEVAAAVYSPYGQWVASAGADRTIRVWRATGRQDVAVLHGHTGAVVAVAFAPGGRQLASLSNETAFWRGGDGTVRVWDVDYRATLPVLRGHTSYVYPVAFSPDGRWIASGGWDDRDQVRLWDAATGEPCATLPHPGIVPTLAYGPDGHWLVTGGDGDDRLRIWDVATARIRKEIRGPAARVRSLAVSPDGRRVTASGWDEQPFQDHLSVYDVTSGERLFSARGVVLAYSPDGRWLAVLDEDNKTVLLLDAQTHETAARFRGHEKFVFAATFSPDSRLLASCSQDFTVRLWEVDSGACQVLRGHTDEVFTAAFHPDGTRLATGGRDRAVWLWDLARGEEVARLQGHTSYVWSLAFSPDGATLASGSGDSTVRLWDTAPLKVRYQARRQAEALRPEAERLVGQLWRQKNDAAAVVEALRADRALSEPLRQAALRAVLRKARPPEAAPAKPNDLP